MEPIVGIDLGTTNSEVALVVDGQPVVFTEDGDPILPSVVGLTEEGKLLVGKAARNQWALAPERTIRSVKRRMGQDVQVPLGDQLFRPQELSAMILRRLCERASEHLGMSVCRAVITVPAYFNDAQRQATREAGALAGLDVVRLLNEPTAASLTYDTGEGELRRLLVYDLGGGTFDVSIVQAQSGVVEVLSSQGDTHLGGDDFDELLLHHVCDRFQSEKGVDLRGSAVSRARVLRAVELAKKHLSFHPFARIQEEFIAESQGRALHLDIELSREEYEELIRPLVNRTMDCVQRALTDARVSVADLQKIVLVGGSSRTPLVGQMLTDALRLPLHQEVDPDLCVAMGAAIEAAQLAGQKAGPVLVDITPHSLGIKYISRNGEGMEHPHRFAPILHRNTPIPSTRSEVFFTCADNQRQVEIDIYQGEHGDVRRNHRVGTFLIEGLAAVPAGNPIVVQFDLTLDGVLRVTAQERASGMQKQVTLDNALARFQRDNRAIAIERLDRLWNHSSSEEPPPPDLLAREEVFEPVSTQPMPVPEPEGQRGHHREVILARALIEKTERLLPHTLPEDRLELVKLMSAMQEAMASQVWGDLHQATETLSEMIFYLEDA
ncbi:MAG: Hsp70 family protein [Gemmataceae bacterium]